MDFLLDKSHYHLKNLHQNINRTPYPFQEKAFMAMNKLKMNNPEGFSSMLVLPTGAGKTYTAAHWILSNYIDKGIKVLWVAHRSELLRQAAETFFVDTNIQTLPTRSSYDTYVVSSEFGRSCNILEANPDLLIASRQSICSNDNIEYYTKWIRHKQKKDDRKLLIVFDEAHHAASVSYRKIIKCMKKYVPHVDILGLTATPFRTAKSEQGSLKNIFNTGNGIVYSIDMNTLIGLGILSKPNHINVHTNIDMTKLFSAEQLNRISKYDITSLDEKSIEKINKNTDRNNLIVDTYLFNKEKFGRTIVFAVDVVNAIALNALFQMKGIKSDFVVSSLVIGLNRSASTERNPKIIKDFKEGKLDVLINVNIVTEGTDIPNIQTVFLARPTTSKILMTQMIGRGLRGESAGGTKETNIVYFIDDWKGLVDFIAPKALLEGDDNVYENDSSPKKILKHYIKLSELESLAISNYHSKTPLCISYNNIIPYGIIKCCYITRNQYGDENTIEREIVVYDESTEIYLNILNDIPKIINDSIDYSNNYIEKISSELFFKYCESGTGKYIGISSSTVSDVIHTYLSSFKIPQIQRFENRVSLFDIAKNLLLPNFTENQLNEKIVEIWNTNEKVRMWYDREFYDGMMHIYFNRIKKHNVSAPRFKLPPKEKMDMGEIKKYYPAYYDELRNYLKHSMYQDDEGYYYSAIQEKGQPPARSKLLSAFEMDHIIPISKGGLTIKENLQMILRTQNLKKGSKIFNKQSN